MVATPQKTTGQRNRKKASDRSAKPSRNQHGGGSSGGADPSSGGTALLVPSDREGTCEAAGQSEAVPVVSGCSGLADLGTGDYVRGVAIDGQQFQGFVDSPGRQYLKLTSGKSYKLKSVELVCRLPEDLEVYCALPGLSRTQKLDSLLSEYRFYNLSSWKTTGEPSKGCRRHNGWEIRYYSSGEEMDISKDGETWYTELKRHPELTGNGKIEAFCRETIDRVERTLQRIDEYEQTAASGSGQPQLQVGDRCYYASPTNTAKIKAIDGQEATLELDHGKTVQVALKHCEPLTDAHIREPRLLEKGTIVRGEDLNGQAHTGTFASLSMSGMALIDDGSGKRRLLVAGTLIRVEQQVVEEVGRATVIARPDAEPAASSQPIPGTRFLHGDRVRITADEDLSNCLAIVDRTFEADGMLWTAVYCAELPGDRLEYLSRSLSFVAGATPSSLLELERLMERETPPEPEQPAASSPFAEAYEAEDRAIAPDNIQPDVIETPSESIISTIDAEIDRLHREATEAEQTANTAGKAAAQLYFELGLKLLDRKPQLGHGNWLPYLQQHDIAERTAQRAMQVANHFQDKSDTLSDLTLTQALKEARRTPLLSKPPAEQLSLMSASDVSIGAEVYFNNLPAVVRRIEGDRLHVQFLGDGTFSNLERDRFTTAPVQVNSAAREGSDTLSRASSTVRSCPACKFCEVGSDERWYCQKFQQYYTEDENPAPKCEQYSTAKKLTLPVHAPIALQSIERRDYRAGETIEMGGHSLQVQMVGSDSITAVDAGGRPHRIAFKAQVKEERRSTVPQPLGQPDIFYAVRKFALLNGRMWNEQVCDRVAADVMKFLAEYEP